MPKVTSTAVKQAIKQVAVVAFDGISPFHLSVPCLVFGEDRDVRGQARYRLSVCAVTPGRLRTNAGFELMVPLGLGGLRKADIVLIPSWDTSLTPPPSALLNALKSAHARGAQVVGLCLGAFVLAEAGLLDGRRATTHWLGAAEFERRYPAIELQADVLYVDDGSVVTSAGTAAGLDCCLHLLRQAFGAEAANQAARRMVVAPHRQGGQAQYIAQPVSVRPQRDKLGAVIEWMLANLPHPQPLDALAARAAMSRRHFTRRFHEATGTTVHAWLVQHRLALAQRLLEDGDDAIEEVAAQSGFGGAVSLRQHFASALKVSPSAYRQQFRKVDR
ncbi:MAG TPA: helix-turn-helix domain-containing protein [Candidatus Aquabacterium excrementipullorum]|nr:helix-turn-helix domain-containing protein [Candidatus Aquabacterium excrementipullorum]